MLDAIRANNKILKTYFYVAFSGEKNKQL